MLTVSQKTARFYQATLGTAHKKTSTTVRLALESQQLIGNAYYRQDVVTVAVESYANILVKQVRAKAPKVLFWEFSLCLSRACLGKMIRFV